MIKQIFDKLPRNPSSIEILPFSSANSNSNSANIDPSRPASNGAQVGPTLLNYVALPSLRDVPISERQNLFIEKLEMCCIVFDFTDPTSNLNEKDVKTMMLIELVDYVSSVNSKFDEIAINEITKMFEANLFRSLPSSNHLLGNFYDHEDDQSTIEPAWPHLKIVYEFFLRFISSSETDAKLAKRYIDQSFVSKLLDLFDSENKREREYLKTILHRLYGKFMVHRPFIRKEISNIFYHFIFETERHNGIAELLEILGSIINGFALPLKEEHKLFLVRALIPLHKPKCMSSYHGHLSYCIIQFVEKDFTLAGVVIRGLLKYWPLTNSSKEVMFISELEEVLEATWVVEFQRCMVPLFCRIGRCINSSHYQVAERSLLLLNNHHIRNLMSLNQKVILPIILPSLERNARCHWNQAVQSLTLNVCKIFSDADPSLFEECLVKFREDENKREKMVERRESIWKKMEDEAAATSKAMRNEVVIVSIFPSLVAIATNTNSRATMGS